VRATGALHGRSLSRPRPFSPEELNAMGIFSKDIKTLDDLFVHTLQDIYYAEQQITKALPQMIAKVSDPQLKQAFQTHLSETEQQIQMVEQVFRMHGHDPKGVTCPAIDGIIDESQEIAGEVEDPQVLDAALLAAAQAVEHYEITRYGTLVAWAKQLGRQDCAAVLHQILEQEKATDAKLNRIAESKINQQAA
jgi:ferritin-like metal-binding protein YciE